MSRLLVTNKSFELLEPYEGKLSRTVLRGESSRKGADLLDICGQLLISKLRNVIISLRILIMLKWM